MSAGNIGKSADGNVVRLPDPSAGRHRVVVSLTEEQMAAAEGWRLANGIAEQSEALGELIRLGLLSEIAKVYHLVTGDKETDHQEIDDRADDDRKSDGRSSVEEPPTTASAFPEHPDR